MNYRGYEAVIEMDEAANVFHGEVINTRDVITFQGRSPKELKAAFEGSIKDYLAFCASRNEEPERPFSGKLVVRMTPDLHRHITLEARRLGLSLNSYIVDRLKAMTLTAG